MCLYEFVAGGRKGAEGARRPTPKKRPVYFHHAHMQCTAWGVWEPDYPPFGWSGWSRSRATCCRDWPSHSLGQAWWPAPARPTGQADPRPMTPAKLNNHDSHKARLAQATRTDPQPQTQQPQPTTGTGPQQSQPPYGPTMDPHSRPSTAGPRQPEPGQPRHTTHCPAPHAAANPTSSTGHIGPTTRWGCPAFRF